MAFALSPERDQEVDDLVTRYPTQRAALIPVLWLCQRQNGWISPEVITWVAERLALSTAVVQGVVTFYTMFQQQPVGEHTIWVCRTLSCDLMGGKAIQEHLEERLGCHAGGTSKDGKFSLFKAECLAACGQAPMVQIDDEYFEHLTVKKLDGILDAYAAGEPPVRDYGDPIAVPRAPADATPSAAAASAAVSSAPEESAEPTNDEGATP